MNTKTKYYARRIITTLLIASPCYVWSQTIVLAGLVGLALVLPGAISAIDLEFGVSLFILLVWVTMFVIGWYGSKLLIVKPKELQSLSLKEQGKAGRGTPTLKEVMTKSEKRS